MKKDLVSYLFTIVIPAVIFMSGGFYLLRLEYLHALEDEETAFRDRADAAAFRERELVDFCMMQPVPEDQMQGGGTQQDVRYQSVAERGMNGGGENPESSDYFKDAQSVFIWKEGRGITWQTGPGTNELAAIKPDMKWVATGRSRTGRGGEYGWFETGEGANRVTVLWAGSIRGKTIYGMTAKLRRDLSERFAFFMLSGFVMAAFLCFSLLAGGGAFVRAARKARNEALQKTTFVSNVSHELKTPLTSIVMRAEMLLDGRYKTDDRRKRAVMVIAEESRRMERMVSELLDFSRLEHNRRKYNNSVFDLADVVRRTAELMKELFPRGGLKISADSPCEICADEDAVKEIIENLLGNAAKYASAYGEVEITLTKSDSGKCYVRVADKGPGLAKEQMKKVFEPFWRADSSTTKSSGGYGIGLPIAIRLARGMGGDLTVAPRNGGGLIFTLSLS